MRRLQVRVLSVLPRKIYKKQGEGEDSIISKDVIKLKGRVIQVLPNTFFLVETEDGHPVRCYLSGRMRRHRIRILEGDRVDIEVSLYNLKQGRIIYRHK